MKFHIGPVPEDPEFDPDGDGWVRLREPRPGQLLLGAVPLGTLMAGAWAVVWSRIVHFGVPTDSFSLTISVPGFLAAVAGLLGFILLHELLHALPAMMVGSTKAVIVGFWPRHLAPYVAYTAALSREAQFVSGAAPFVLLTLLPFVMAFAFPGSAEWMAALSILNVLGSAADLIMLGLLLRQVPSEALVRNQGFATWWRVAV